MCFCLQTIADGVNADTSGQGVNSLINIQEIVQAVMQVMEERQRMLNGARGVRLLSLKA